MTARMNDHDWELLSAYLDLALSSIERKKVEERLSTDMDFRTTYISLARTRGILRAVPDIKRRRNFILTPEMIRPHGWRWVIPVINFSSAAAGILAFIFLFMNLMPVSKLTALTQPEKESMPFQHEVVELTPIQSGGEPGILQNSKPAEEKGMPSTATENPAMQADTVITGGSAAAPMVGEAPAASCARQPEVNQKQIYPLTPTRAAVVPMLKMESTGTAGSGMGIPEPGADSPMTEEISPETYLPSMAPQKKDTATGLPESMAVPAASLAANEAEANSDTAPAPNGPLADSPISPEMPPVSTQSALKPAILPSETVESQHPGTFSWPASRTGGIFLLVSITLGVIGTILKKRDRL